MNFEGRVALITGGTAEDRRSNRTPHLRHGSENRLVSRDESDRRRIEYELLRNGAEGVFLKADLSHPDEAWRIVRQQCRLNRERCSLMC
jgi:hypothetical protein